MTSYLTLSGSFEEIDDLFDNAHYLSVRHFKHIGNHKWEIILRHSENYPEEVKRIQSAKTVKELKAIDNSRAFKN